MNIEFSRTYITVTREQGDSKYYGSKSKSTWGSAESGLLHAIKKQLIAMGFDVIKKRIQADGHLYGTTDTQYIRSRDFRPGSIMIYDGQYAIRDLAEDWNRDGKIILSISPMMDDRRATA